MTTTSGEDRAKQGEALPRIDRCPFCGGEAEWHDDEAVIQCARCLSRSGVRRNQAYGTRLWNQRAAEIHAHVNMDDDAPPEVREALHALIVHTHDQMSRESRAATRAGEHVHAFVQTGIDDPAERFYCACGAYLDDTGSLNEPSAAVGDDVERVARAIMFAANDPSGDGLDDWQGMARAAMKALAGGGGSNGG